MMEKKIIQLANQLGQKLKNKSIILATAESCTGGGIAQAITEVSGSSAWFDRGFVTYSNISKVEMLQVEQRDINEFGAVSEQIAIQMVMGALRNSAANMAVSVTGIAGPTGGSGLKPVGTVYIAYGMIEGNISCQKFIFKGDRVEVRKQTIINALVRCLEHIL